MNRSVSKKLGHVTQIDGEQIQPHLGNLVRGSVEETLTKLLGAEAEQLHNIVRYERTEARKDIRAGHSPLQPYRVCAGCNIPKKFAAGVACGNSRHERDKHLGCCH